MRITPYITKQDSFILLTFTLGLWLVINVPLPQNMHHQYRLYRYVKEKGDPGDGSIIFHIDINIL